MPSSKNKGNRVTKALITSQQFQNQGSVLKLGYNSTKPAAVPLTNYTSRMENTASYTPINVVSLVKQK